MILLLGMLCGSCVVHPLLLDNLIRFESESENPTN